MKIKDIEKKLKNESESVRVPDVYPSVKKAPINRLLNGELPVQAFKKHLAMRLLVFVLLVFGVCAIALSALWLTDGNTSAIPASYVLVSVSRADGEEEVRYGFATGNDGNIAAAYVEMRGGNETFEKIDGVAGKDWNEAIKGLYMCKNGDKVFISAQCESADAAAMTVREAESALSGLYAGDMRCTVRTVCNDADKKAEWVGYINGNLKNGEVVSLNMGVSELIQTYISLYTPLV